MITVPVNFDGEAFGASYGSFRISEGELICPDHPELTQEIVDTFVVDMDRFARIEARRDNAKTDAKAIPNFASWDEQQFIDWFNTHLGDTIIDGIANYDDLKVVLKDIVNVQTGLTRFMIATRNKLWPDLPED